MLRINLLVAVAVAAGVVGCGPSADTCDDFPAPCTGPNCGQGYGAYGMPAAMADPAGTGGGPVMAPTAPAAPAMRPVPAPAAPAESAAPPSPPAGSGATPPAPMDPLARPSERARSIRRELLGGSLFPPLRALIDPVFLIPRDFQETSG